MNFFFKIVRYSPIYTILLLSFILRILLTPFGTHFFDFNTFFAWSQNLSENGFSNFYKGWSDYLPGYLYVLYFLGKISIFFALSDQFNLILYKFPAILGDLGTGFLIYKIVKPYSPKWANLSSAFYLFNPAIFVNSSLWGQVDGLIPLFILLSFYFLRKNIFLSATFLALGTLIKPQAGFITPLFVLDLLKNKQIKDVLLFGLICLVIFILGFLPFTSLENSLSFILNRLEFSASQYPYTSVNAFNFWAVLFPLWHSDFGLNLFSWGIVGLLSTIILFLQPYKKDKRYFGFGIAMIVLIIFLFLTRIHERHLLPVFAPLAIFATAIPVAWVAYIVLSITYLLNMLFSYVWATQNYHWIFSQETIKIVSLVNIAVFFALFSTIFPYFKDKVSFFSRFSKIKNINSKNLKIKHTHKILFLILLFSLITRIINLQNPKEFYFDEVYHVFTAQEIVRGNSSAWEYWSTPPKGFAYEWTHPPLAKLFMAASMKVFGLNSFAWRLPGVFLGVACVYLVFLLTKTLFKSELTSLFASFLFTLDGLPFTLSRIGMNDIYFLFFLLGTILFLLKDKLFWSSLFLGAALATKWTSFFIIPILFVVWVLYKRNFKLPYFYFLFIPIVVYFLSYVPFFTSGHNFQEWWNTQQQMWWYHTQLKATHPYSSPWWSWPILLKPLWAYTGNNNNSNIYFSGNQLIFYAGLISVFSSIFFFVKEKRKELYLVIFCYLALFLPWSLSPRIMFLYHYLPVIPFMVILLSFILTKLIEAKYQLVVVIFLLLTGLIFLLNYPSWSAL